MPPSVRDDHGWYIQMFLFLILIISWALGCSSVAYRWKDQCGSGSLCYLGSDGAAALLSACSLVSCYSHQFVFPCCTSLIQLLLNRKRKTKQLVQSTMNQLAIARGHIIWNEDVQMGMRPHTKRPREKRWHQGETESRERNRDVQESKTEVVWPRK